MPFSGPFREPFVAPIFSPGGVTPWYLLGGVTAAQCVAAYQPKGAADLAASKINLAHSGSNDAIAGVDPSFDTTTGWSFNGTTQYLLTNGLVAANDQTWSALVRFTNANADRGLFGDFESSSKQFLIGPRSGLNVYYGSGGSLVVGPNATSGVLGIAGNKGYRNGTADTGTISAGTGSMSFQIALGAYSTGSSSVGGFFDGKIQAIAFYNIALSSTQVSLISTAMAAL